ncbi:acetyl-CoA carboxylase biotin carboxylase subunit [Oceanicella actignis]|uniref:acetyl-CoA carboxylase biotin carboxylase subunit n=1 Tax=Oceanicella actignis TaxID=1189325 RepID=UPI0011E6DC75|nr:acetyl/propionyl/methylcrotonyl-CoA carboxylase subunit alpha [Oceanicella actignis]TYO84631.1 biotin carboxyl carrier protein /biotin carboxylase [Oceanicella actignis]
MFKKILIANRGEIACRVIKTARKMGIATVAVYSDADKDALHVRMADEAVHIGPPPASESYIVIDKILDAVRRTGAQAVHPGYGFLSENSRFAKALEDEGVVFIGPPASAIEAMGDKITSKKLAAEAGVSTVPGYMGLIADADEAVRISEQIGYPVMIKASAGGGGKGMRIAWNAEEVREGFQSSKNEAMSSFGDDRIFIEKFVTQPRHIEIQVMGDRHGNVIHLNERECSIQRRNQKVIEEAPSPFLDPETRAAMGAQAVALAKAVNYCSAGTVEFIVDGDRNFYFLEMNTRLQVEHPVTELITGLDLVELMIRVAAGEKLPLTQEDVGINGWAIESRLYAEDPYRNFLPSIGRLTRYRPPAERSGPDGAVRNDTGVYEGGEISMHYDPMIAKLCSWGPDRAAAIEVMRNALDEFEVEGIGHNLPFCQAVMDHPRFISGDITTAFIAEEFPDGFHGVTLPDEELRRIAAGAAAMKTVAARREGRISGVLSPHDRRAPRDWVVSIGAREWRAHVSPLARGHIMTEEGEELAIAPKGRDPRNPDVLIHGYGAVKVRFEDGTEATVEGDWTPGDRLARATIDGAPLVAKVDMRPEGFRIRRRGADLDVKVREPRVAELARLMPEKLPPDTSKLLLCPMPGLVVSIAVEEGQEVQEGQPLCTVEAMKMENVLRAERAGVVARINVAPGASLAVDEVIMEFE